MQTSPITQPLVRYIHTTVPHQCMQFCTTMTQNPHWLQWDNPHLPPKLSLPIWRSPPYCATSLREWALLSFPDVWMFVCLFVCPRQWTVLLRSSSSAAAEQQQAAKPYSSYNSWSNLLVFGHNTLHRHVHRLTSAFFDLWPNVQMAALRTWHIVPIWLV